ncbi:polymeric immunoglobulin receptor-like [Astyanax mexicanus]|nr:polymeric immunoglobulin receptor-like [Astyanax mexicanus]
MFHLTLLYYLAEKVASVRVSGVLGGRIMMECKHPEENHKSKFFCKESRKECSEKTYSRKQYQWEKTGGFTVFDDTSKGSLMVFLINVTEGIYRCGVDVSEFYEKYTEVTVEVTEDPCCGKTISQVGRIGETLKIFCQNPLTFRSNPKYFCKEEDDHICQDISSLRPAEKYSLSDHNQTGLFIVSVFNLTLSDAGVYWCGVETSEKDLRYTSLTTKVQISIKFDALIGYEDSVIQIRCPYASNFKQHSKHFCKENEEKKCFTQQKNLQPSTQRFSLSNNITAGVFTVTIRGLTAEDAGKYWCAVKTGDVLMKYLSNELKIIMKQELRVIGREALNVSISCTSSRTIDSKKKNNGKFFCMGKHPSSCDQDGVKVSSERNRRGRFSLSDDASSGIFTVSITDLREEDSGTYWCGEESSASAIYTKVHLLVTKDFPGFSAIIFITGSVSVVLLLIGGLILIFCKTRCTKTQGPSSTNRTVPVNNEEVLSANHDYEEINPTTHRSRRNASSPNNRSDTENTEACIYSTVQLPKEEGLTYATVSFQKNPDSPSDGSVTVIKNDSSTEYATIKHHSRRK